MVRTLVKYLTGVMMVKYRCPEAPHNAYRRPGRQRRGLSMSWRPNKWQRTMLRPATNEEEEWRQTEPEHRRVHPPSGSRMKSPNNGPVPRTILRVKRP